MGKNVYSIVLLDEVVEAIDAAALVNRTSRSNMINRILASYVNLQTPEARVENVFSAVEQLFSNSNDYKTDYIQGGSLINIHTSLNYKYNPGVKYTFEVFEAGPVIGRMRVSMRTKNPELIQSLKDFYSLWTTLEKEYVDARPSFYEFVQGKFSRHLRFSEQLDILQISHGVADYILLFDAALKKYFLSLPFCEKTIIDVKNLYEDGLSDLLQRL